MTNLAEKFPDREPPTKPIEPLSSRVLVLATRIERLATLALERLMVAPDSDAVTAACADLATIVAIAGELR